MKKRSLGLSSAAWAVFLAGAAFAQEEKKPETPKEEFEATITALKGTVDVKRPEDKDWVPAATDMKLKKGSEICTAVASTATLQFSGNIKVEVKPLTEAKVDELAKRGGAVNADVQLKFGTIEVDIQKGDLRADMKVVAPNSTTSVSGSHGLVRAPATPGAVPWVTLRTYSGTWSQSLPGRNLEIPLRGEGVVNNLGYTRVDLSYINTVDHFINFFGRNPSELYRDAFGLMTGDHHAGLLPLFEFRHSPMAAAFAQPQALPLPPPPPPGP